jgi:hypothetical protein
VVLYLRESQVATPWQQEYANTDGETNTWSMRLVAGSGVQVYCNGRLQSPTTTSGGTFPPTTIYMEPIGSPIWLGDGSEYSAFGALYGGALWTHDIGSDVVARLSANLYAALYAPQRLAVAGAAAPALPTLSSATYQPGSITSSGFRPRVTAS